MIINANITHLNQIIDIEQEAFGAPWDYSMFIDEFRKANAYFTVTIENETVLGFLIINIIDNTADLFKIAVRKTDLRKGIGSNLLITAIEYLKSNNIKKILLEVNSNNHEAISLYTKTGFKTIAARKNYYHDGDALIMELNI